MIKVGTEFEIERDNNCWALHHYREGFNKKAQKPTRTKKTTYYNTLPRVCQEIIDRRAGMAETLDGVVEQIDRAREELAREIKAAGVC